MEKTKHDGDDGDDEDEEQSHHDHANSGNTSDRCSRAAPPRAFEDQGSLFEAVAGLAAAMPPEQLQPALQRMLEGPVANLAELLGADASRLASDTQGYAAWAARNVEVIGIVSKSFSRKQERARDGAGRPISLCAPTPPDHCGN